MFLASVAMKSQYLIQQIFGSCPVDQVLEEKER